MWASASTAGKGTSRRPRPLFAPPLSLDPFVKGGWLAGWQPVREQTEIFFMLNNHRIYNQLTTQRPWLVTALLLSCCPSSPIQRGTPFRVDYSVWSTY